jgi:hydroxylamine reductase
MEQKMFCYQCQETAGCKGCTVSGVCGKKPDVAAMQDLLVYVTKGLSAVTTRLRAEGQKVCPEINHLTEYVREHVDRKALAEERERKEAHGIHMW